MKQTYEIWLEGRGGDSTIHIGTPKQIQRQIASGDISYGSKRLLELADVTFEEAEERASQLMDDLDLRRE